MSFYSVTKFSILSQLNVINRFTLEQSWGLLEIYFRNMHENAQKCYTKFDRKEGLTVSAIHKFVAKVPKSGLIVDAPKWESAHTVRSPENIEVVTESLRENP